MSVHLYVVMHMYVASLCVHTYMYHIYCLNPCILLSTGIIKLTPLGY